MYLVLYFSVYIVENSMICKVQGFQFVKLHYCLVSGSLVAYAVEPTALEPHLRNKYYFIIKIFIINTFPSTTQ